MNIRRRGHRFDDVQALFKEYIDYCISVKRLRSETIRGYKRVWATFLKLMGISVVSEITETNITAFFKLLQSRDRIVGKTMRNTGVKDSTVATYASKLHSFLEWLVERGELPTNPLKNVRRRTPIYNDIRALTDYEIQKLRAAIENHGKSLPQLKRDRAIFATLVFCGLRRGELLGLRLTDVDLEKRILRVRADTSKSKRPRDIGFGVELKLILQDYLDERRKRIDKRGDRFYRSPAFFISLIADNGLTNDGMKHWVEELRRHSGVKFHLHEFRHTFACNVARIGGNAIALQRLLGHNSLDTTQVYVRSLGVEDFREITDNLELAGIA
jgi:site-specific recombinase XerD